MSLNDKDYNPFKHIHSRLDIIEAGMNEIKKAINIPDREMKLTRKMIKEKYHISYGTIHNHMKEGKLKFIKLGNRTLFHREDVEAWIESNNLK